ncbi:predicted DNA ligase [Salmonella phage Vi06]|uniref:DNA ligase n=1 Tax=Salmonella phage Vi06 TaxID=866889 RepID=E1XU86_9CAUD|nr:DNA ligase [Salmonella phage Vi06]CBV65205.1 predicted DNA ligase [Salmonella phage Vi06]
MMNIKTSPFKAVSFVESSIEKALDNAGYLIADCKYDGVRGNICVDNTANSCWLSRVSKTIPALEHLNGFDVRWKRLLNDDRCFYKDGFMLDGELMVKGVDFNTGSGLLRTKWTDTKNQGFHDVFFVEPVSKKDKIPFRLHTGRLQVKLFAVLPLHIVESGEDCDVMTLLMQEHVKNMLPLLQDYLPEIDWQAAESYEVYDMVELQKLYEKKRAEGHEGLIVKDPMCVYRRGKKSGWFKMKPSEEADGIITGVVWGTPGLANEGKVIGFTALLESGRVVDATNISRALMDEFTANVKEHGEDYYNGWACQIAYMEETKDGNLRHPSFTCFRGTEDNPKEKV